MFKIGDRVMIVWKDSLFVGELATVVNNPDTPFATRDLWAVQLAGREGILRYSPEYLLCVSLNASPDQLEALRSLVCSK